MSDPITSYPLWLQSLLRGPTALAADARCIETHISWVVLAGERVFKFKKPLSLGFLDFGTLALRRHACEEELRINRRTAPQLYEAVVALVGPAQAPRLVPLVNVQPQDEVLEYGVQMQRFADGQLLAEQLAAGALQSSELSPLAERVAQLHASAAVAPPDSDWGSAALVRQQAQTNLDTLAALPLPETDRRTLQALQAWTQREGERLQPLLAARKAAGQVRECHGDLHLGNLVQLADGPQLFDAIEFSEALRFIDPMADVAFLCMDLQARGRPDLGWHFLNGWLEHSGDYAGLELLPWYLVYRALVRAMVAGLRCGQAGQGEQNDASLQALQRYLALAGQLCQPRPRALWLAQGVSGAGKSHHSAPLVAARGMVRLRADVERKRLFGLAPTAASAARVSQSIYDADTTVRTYAQLLALARTVLEAGFAVLVDATFLAYSQRAPFRALAAEKEVPFAILAFDAPVPVLQERVQRRLQRGGNASEATLEVLAAQLARREPLSTQEQALALCIDTTQPVNWAVLMPPAEVVSAPASPATTAASPSS
ncbi:AAA family ATPase [Simplicispira psychrophila]|uniref:bifunctional aminoglycoside phosphotransferase/ATP-binding protein n=1 Tax=Simplicispira psychrophila TaxID=80882 RepID=UPI0006923786|nr:bifunctional aminoglycoside phosphotransferase/ATP-binding protein [Simplicispira psychrophila]